MVSIQQAILTTLHAIFYIAFMGQVLHFDAFSKHVRQTFCGKPLPVIVVSMSAPYSTSTGSSASSTTFQNSASIVSRLACSHKIDYISQLQSVLVHKDMVYKCTWQALSIQLCNATKLGANAF